MYFCCLPGEVGAFESKLIDHGGICLPKGTELSSTAMATRVGAMTTGEAGAATSASAQATSASTEATSSAASSATKATGSNAAGMMAVPGMEVPAVLGAVAWVAGVML